ncbi:CRA1B protein, partial [Atractosteus spatula]|nr:CRA1B protein [Atractosteus spatula]
MPLRTSGALSKMATNKPPKPNARSGQTNPRKTTAGQDTKKKSKTGGLAATTTSKPMKKKLELHSPTATKPSTAKPATGVLSKKEQQSPSRKTPEPKGATPHSVKPTPFVPITPAATDGFQTFDLDPTPFSLLVGPPGLKGEPGLPICIVPGVNWYVTEEWDLQDLRENQDCLESEELGVHLVHMEILALLVSQDSRVEKEMLAFHLVEHPMGIKEILDVSVLLVYLGSLVGRDRRVILVSKGIQENQGSEVQMEAQVPKVILAGRGFQGILVKEDHQDLMETQEKWVPLVLMEFLGSLVTWVLLGKWDFQGHRDSRVKLEFLGFQEKLDIRATRESKVRKVKMAYQAHQALRATEGKWVFLGLQEKRERWDIQVRQVKVGLLDHQDELGLLGLVVSLVPEDQKEDGGLEALMVQLESVGPRERRVLKASQENLAFLGPPGQMGEPGLPGEPGEKGAIGPPGSIGEQGLIGQRGEPGLEGEAGPAGPDGTKGEKGDMGPEGEKGEKGEIGLKGKEGTPGDPGLTGVRKENQENQVKEESQAERAAKVIRVILERQGPLVNRGQRALQDQRDPEELLGPWVTKVHRALWDHLDPKEKRGNRGMMGRQRGLLVLQETEVLLETEGTEANQGTQAIQVTKGWTDKEASLEPLGCLGILDLQDNQDLKDLRVMRARKENKGAGEKLEAEARQGSRETMAKLASLGMWAIVAKWVRRASLVLRAHLGSRERGACLVKPVPPESEDLREEWECQGNREIQDPKGSRVTLENQDFQALWNYQGLDLPMLDQGTEIFKTLHYLSNLIQSIKNPLGTHDNPARICRDLKDCEQRMNDGTYWIDPNLGCASDTIEVTCNFTNGGQTCLKPVSVSKLEIGVGRVQMNFLHLLSSEAVQHIIIHCLNVPVWREGKSDQPSKNAVAFRAWNGQMIKAGGPVVPDVIQDDCRIQDGRWHQTHFVFHTQDPNLLPIVNVYNLPVTKPGLHYHLEVGPVCFL